MAQKFKFRYVNEIVGGFVVLVVVLLAAGIFFAANAQKWFEPMIRYRIRFPSDGSYGLKEGAQVLLLGTGVGRVDRIQVADDGSMEGEISVEEDFSRFVRKNSEAVIRKTLVVTGDSYLELSRGVGELLPAESFIPCRRDEEITEQLQDTLHDIRYRALALLDQGQIALKEYTSLAQELRDPNGPVMQLIISLKELAAGLEEGKGPAGAVLRDEQLAAQLKKIVGDLQLMTARLTEVSSQIPGIMAKFQAEIDHIPGTVLQARETLRESEKLMEAVQDHWLLSPYVKQDSEAQLLPPSAVSLEDD